MSEDEEVATARNWDADLGYSIIASPAFTFRVGPEKTPFLIHSQLFKNISDPLHIMINGDMQEAQERSTELLDTDPLAFAAVIEYAYTGFYTGAEHRKDQLEPEQSLYDAGEMVTFIYNASWKDFLRYRATFTEIELEWYAASTDRYENISPGAMILHAQVATLADKWLITDLKNRALCYIWSELSLLKGSTLPWILEVLKEFLRQPELISDVRRIFAMFYAGTSQTFETSEVFQDSIAQYPDFVLEMFRIISKHTIAYSE